MVPVEMVAEKVRLYRFKDEEELQAHLLALNYDHGLHAELACMSNGGQVFIAAGTDEGDSMGFAYYFVGPEGYMYHYGTEYEGEEIDKDWKPQFPVFSLGEPVFDSPRVI